ncbi:MAG: histidine phosphatase family protein [Gemmatimonadaceae bacterium]|nr:histidine phosphatase family protein [Gemmatimonadaceae bacterium]
MRITRNQIARSALLAFMVAAQGCVKVGVNRVTPTTGATTVIIVRHAEKGIDDPRDPSLTQSGRERAIALRDVLIDANVSAIYATQYRRNRQTAEPLAQQLGLTVIERPVNAANSATYAADIAREVLNTNQGKTVVIVGHSNTVPQIVQAFSRVAVKAMEDSEYDHIFIVVVPAGGSPSLVNVRFGRPAP